MEYMRVGKLDLSSCTCTYGLYLAAILPCCMECKRGLAMRKVSVRLSVCLSVRPSNAWVVTKRKKDLSRFLYHTKDHLA